MKEKFSLHSRLTYDELAVLLVLLANTKTISFLTATILIKNDGVSSFTLELFLKYIQISYTKGTF